MKNYATDHSAPAAHRGGHLHRQLADPTAVSARALSYASATASTEASTPASINRVFMTWLCAS